MYVAPSIKEHVIELEQGIAAGSQGGVSNPQTGGWGAGGDDTNNGEGS